MDESNSDRGVYRSIYVSLWDDPDFTPLPSASKFVLIYLRTSPLSNIPCIFRFYREAILEHTGLKPEAVESSLNTLCDTHWIEIEKGIVWIRNGLRFNQTVSLRNPKHVEAIRKILIGLPKLEIVKKFCTYYGIPIPYDIPSEIPIREGIEYPMPITEPEPEPELEKNIVRIPYSEIRSLWSEILPECIQPHPKNTNWYPNFKSRYLEDPKRQDVSYWQDLFRILIRGSPFLMGQVEPTNGHRRFKLSIEWLMNRANFYKVIQGAYTE